MKIFQDQNVLVTGATGSFGKHFISKVLEHGRPRRLVIFSRDELKQFEMQQNLPETKYPIRYFIGDVRDRERLMRACAGVDIIIHAAAMKHITAAEYNPTECIATNVLGAQNLIDAAISNDVKRVVALSTDKAANPINLYGATKLCSDKLFVAANNLAGHHRTRFSVVRYGNVIGSRGSVIPFFKRLVAEGKTVLPITHPDMTRFVISLDQGVEFVALAATEMTGGELFVPKLPSVRITDILTHLGKNIGYEVVGVRAGEKLHEVMIPMEESRNVIDLGPYFVIQPAFNWWNTDEFLKKIQNNKNANNLKDSFEYASNTNDWWLSDRKLAEYVGSTSFAVS